MSIPRLESEANIVDGKLVIALKIDTLSFAAQRSDYFFNCEEAGQLMKITNETEFAESVARALNVEAEDGSTPVMRMLDKAFEFVCEQGEPGVDDA